MKKIVTKIVSRLVEYYSISQLPKNTKIEVEKIQNLLSPVNVIVDDNNRNQTVNILIPRIAANMSAGPISILYFAKFLQDIGLNVRLLVYQQVLSKEKIRFYIINQSKDLQRMGQTVEIECIELNSNLKLAVSSNDMSIATFWTSAFQASQIQSNCVNKRFIYFIQDDERIFYPNGSWHALIENTYKLDFYPLFSTEILKKAFLQNDIGGIRTNNKNSGISQQSPSNYYLPPKNTFMKRPSKKRFVFYGRPNNARNCYELSVFIIIKAVEMGILNEDWEIIGIGYNKMNLPIGNCRYIKMLPKMALQQYKNMLYTFDVGLSLMESPHYSMPPIDLALSGCSVVTNTYQTKTKEEFFKISKNLIGCDLNPDSLINTLKKAVFLSDNLEERYENAKNTNYPIGNDVFTEEHKEWIEKIMIKYN